ncbi:hypothetical protein ACFV1N_17700 [Streptosporangium canum]|uniref:hypothetical protein n=1 Tax=Streptosporangium canum TaxID=324952 RepID=UPI0036C4943A
MSPPNSKNGPRSTTSEARLNDQMAANDIPKVQPQADRRTNRGGQTSLPIVAGLLFIGGPGRKTADLMVPECEQCGRDHRHACPLPAPALTKTKRADCGARYQVMPKHLRGTRRGRRAA